MRLSKPIILALFTLIIVSVVMANIEKNKADMLDAYSSKLKEENLILLNENLELKMKLEEEKK